MKRKQILILSLVLTVVTIALFALPFLNIKNHGSKSGLFLIFNLSKRVELTAKGGSGSSLVLISHSFPLLLSLLMYILTAVMFAACLFRKSKKLSYAAIFTGAIAYISYGVQLSDTGTSVVEFFANLLSKQQASDGSYIYRVAQTQVTTGIGAKLLVFAGLIPVFAAIVIRVLEYIEKNRHETIQTPWSIAFRQFRRNKLALFGVGILFVFTIWCFYGPVFSKFALLETKVSIAKRTPSLEYILGTDAIGRDIFTRLMYGGRISLTVGFVAVLIEVLIGTLVGGIAGYYGGKVDSILMRIVDIFLSLPYLPVVIILGTVMSDLEIPPQERIYFVMLIIGLLSWPVLARIVRGQILSLREQEFMLAAESLGLSDRRKIVRHLIPNVIPHIIVSATLGIGGAILSESALSFLGLGVSMPYPSWGNMIQAVKDAYDFAHRWWLWIPPGLCIFITVLAINFVGDGLRDAFDPKMKR